MEVDELGFSATIPDEQFSLSRRNTCNDILWQRQGDSRHTASKPTKLFSKNENQIIHASINVTMNQP